MKKTMFAMLTAALLATGLTGCAATTSSNADANKQQPATPPLNSAQDGAKNNTNSTPNVTDSTQMPVPDSTDASHVEIRDAFNLSGYRIVTPVALSAIAMGKVEMPLDDKQRLALAKAITAAISESGWQQNDQAPGIFLRQDGGAFAIGIKRQNSDLTLNLYEVQQDGTWKQTKKDTKPGKK